MWCEKKSHKNRGQKLVGLLLINCASSPLSLHQFCLTRDSKYGLVELIGTLYVSILHRLLFILSILHRPLCYGYVRLRIPPLIFLLSLSNLTQNQNIEIIQLQFFDAFTALQIELNFCLIFDDENGKQNWPKPWRHHKGSLVSRSLFNLAIIFLIYLVLFDKKFLDVLLQHWMGQ